MTLQHYLPAIHFPSLVIFSILQSLLFFFKTPFVFVNNPVQRLKIILVTEGPILRLSYQLTKKGRKFKCNITRTLFHCTRLHFLVAESVSVTSGDINDFGYYCSYPRLKKKLSMRGRGKNIYFG